MICIHYIKLMLTCRYYSTESNLFANIYYWENVCWSVNFEWNWCPHLLKLLISCLFEICDVSYFTHWRHSIVNTMRSERKNVPFGFSWKNIYIYFVEPRNFNVWKWKLPWIKKLFLRRIILKLCRRKQTAFSKSTGLVSFM